MINKLTIVGYAVGSGIVISSWFRWTVQYADMSQALLGIGIGGVLLGGAFIYEWVRNLSNDYKKIDKKIDDLIKHVFKKEFK